MSLPAGPHPCIAVRPRVDPVVTRTVGVVIRPGQSLPPSAGRMHEELMMRWRSPEEARG